MASSLIDLEQLKAYLARTHANLDGIARARRADLPRLEAEAREAAQEWVNGLAPAAGTERVRVLVDRDGTTTVERSPVDDPPPGPVRPAGGGSRSWAARWRWPPSRCWPT